MDINTAHPRIYFDGNACLAERSYALVQGALEDLRKLGLTPAAAMGSRFTFVQEDESPDGEADALIFNGTIAHSAALGHFILADPGGVHWLSQVTGQDA